MGEQHFEALVETIEATASASWPGAFCRKFGGERLALLSHFGSMPAFSFTMLCSTWTVPF